MRTLRSPEGCPWDKEQSHLSLIPCLIEECYECVDALRGTDKEHLKEELGDLLLQVIFHAQLAEEAQDFTLKDIIQGLNEKLIRRHPHIFQKDRALSSSQQVLTQWEAIKKQERQQEKSPFLQGTGEGLPALLRAVKLQKKAAKVGFDWPHSEAVCAKIEEELAEVRETQEKNEGAARLEEELGDLLFAVSNLCRKEHIDPEIALHRANQKFERRFGLIEQALQAEKIPLEQAGLEKMDSLWNQIKKEEKNASF